MMAPDLRQENLVFPAGEKVCQIKNPLNWTAEKSQLMADACREFAQFHFEHNSDIRALYLKRGFRPELIQDESDIASIPSLGVSAMKTHLLTTLPEQWTALKLTSSGTRGQKTQIWMDQGSLDRVQRMMDVYWEQEKFSSDAAANYLIFSYDPADAQDLGVAYTEKNQMRFAPIADSFFAVRKNNQGDWIFHREEALAKLELYENDQKPVRIFGMPAFLFEFLELLKNREKYFRLPAGSLVITGGGWKAAEDKKISRQDFRQSMEAYFGIPQVRIRDAYGMAEHCAPYFECSSHRFHIPVYARIIIRDPITLEECPRGSTGLMQLISPFNAMMPNLSILSTDYGQIDAEACPCGQDSPTFTLQGRAGLSQHKGCAITASEIVKRKIS